jgi:Trp operon repressor
MEHLSSDMEQQQDQYQEQQQIQWRRDKVQELCSKGYSQREISQILQVGLATVNKDTSYLQTIKYDVFIYIHILLFIG